MSTMFTRRILVLTIIMLTLASFAQAECYIGGTVTAEPNTDPMYPGWKYTATISWDTDTRYALSHLNMLLDAAAGTCSCDDLASALVWENIPGTSEGEGGCEVTYETFLECNGDPSIPGVGGILFKLEPTSGCEPGTTGTATFCFYSPYGPAPIDEEMLLLFDKFGQLNCSGFLSGFFPGLSCDPVSADATSWDGLKVLFR